jgi:predicted kinase
MRKWMSDRLKRRKKASEKPAGEPAPTPLQPKYFDADMANPAPPEESREPEAPRPEPVQAQDGPGATTAPAPRPQTQTGGDSGRRRRRRRGRGGRGRGRDSRSSAPAAPSPVTSEPSAPEESRSPAVAAVSPSPEPPREPKGTVVLSIGLPGSGKSAWFKRHNIIPLSSDMLRALLFDDPTEQRFQDLVFSNLRSMLKARLIARRPMNYVDATNLTPHERSNWIKLAHDYGYEVQAVFFDVPVEVCLERNQRRERVVPEDIMQRMAAKLRAPTFEEGFAKITVVKVKKKDGEAAAP